MGFATQTCPYFFQQTKEPRISPIRRTPKHRRAQRPGPGPASLLVARWAGWLESVPLQFQDLARLSPQVQLWPHSPVLGLEGRSEVSSELWQGWVFRNTKPNVMKAESAVAASFFLSIAMTRIGQRWPNKFWKKPGRRMCHPRARPTRTFQYRIDR